MGGWGSLKYTRVYENDIKKTRIKSIETTLTSLIFSCRWKDSVTKNRALINKPKSKIDNSNRIKTESKADEEEEKKSKSKTSFAERVKKVSKNSRQEGTDPNTRLFGLDQIDNEFNHVSCILYPVSGILCKFLQKSINSLYLFECLVVIDLSRVDKNDTDNGLKNNKNNKINETINLCSENGPNRAINGLNKLRNGSNKVILYCFFFRFYQKFDIKL